MKKIFSVILVCSMLMLCVVSVYAANKIYGFSSLTGGAIGSLDSIPGYPTARTGDQAFGIVSTRFYAYYFDSTLTTTESSPTIIAPNTGTGRWTMVSVSGDAIAPATTTQYSIPYWSATSKSLIDGIAPGAVNGIMYSDGTSWARLAASSNAISFLTAADYTAMSALLSLLPGTNIQAYNISLDTLSSLGTANQLFGVNGAGGAAEWKSTIQLLIDDSAAQFQSAIASKGTLKLLLSGSTSGKLLTTSFLHTDNKTLYFPDPTTGDYVTYGSAALRFTTGGTTARVITVPDAAFTVARTDAANTFTGIQSMTSPAITTSILPASVGGATIGSAAAEWGSIYLSDGKVIYGQDDQSATLTSSASLWTANNFAVFATGYLKIPYAAAPTTDAVGKVALDESLDGTGGLRAYTNATHLIAPVLNTQCITVKDPLATSDYPAFRTPRAITLVNTHCLIDGATNIVGQFDTCDTNGANCAVSDSADMTCTTTNSSDTALNGTPAVAAGGYVRWRSATASGTPTALIACFDYSND